MSGTGGLKTVTGGSFPASIWSAFMKDALKKKPVAEFPAPPENALTPIECPDFIETDLEEIPFGCPIPEIVTEFGPENTGSDPVVTDSNQPVVPEPTATNEFGPEPAPTDEPVDEGRPD